MTDPLERAARPVAVTLPRLAWAAVVQAIVGYRAAGGAEHELLVEAQRAIHDAMNDIEKGPASTDRSRGLSLGPDSCHCAR